MRFLKMFVLAWTLAGPAYADLRLDLESGDESALESVANPVYRDALREFYRGNPEAAHEVLSKAASLPGEAGWLKEYLDGLIPLTAPMKTAESEHFILKTPARDAFLASYALDALEKAYASLGAQFDIYPKEKIRVEIYPTQEAFSRASTLSKEILDKSGAIGICKFRRLMILSPEQMAFGYRWLDTLSHEYAHYLINVASRARCPLWLHEGTAKYMETLWRVNEPEYLTPGNRTELARALKDGKLVPFARMEPSMVYLDDYAQVRLAFSQVAHAVHFIRKIKFKGVPEIFAELSKGKSRQEAFQKVLGLTPEKFEFEWKDFLGKEKLKESPGASPDVIKFGGADELEEFATTSIRGHIRLGDRMRQNGRPDAALPQYEKALALEPGNPVALVKAARVLLQLNRKDEARAKLKVSVEENPNYAPADLMLGALAVQDGDWEAAEKAFVSANALNPFNPEVHRQLSAIYLRLGKMEESLKEQEVYTTLLSR